ncbi:unnamed protein product [Spirodela intermedia]|uniref:Uncharacterized protein n=2 Tax=Spirodela intermedia TaxID=51605 RepID=A0A7I8LHX2_SPIIN|nr:unnamed protein product [Spirodela intermedia]CAA6672222.1 unnamed protein product [Spirodela intermedia]CAA7409380.1 unnamed protein product [Spirodela intermedia]
MGEKTHQVATVVFLLCSLSLLLTRANRHLSPPGTAERRQLEPVGFLLSRASAVALVYLSTAACGGAATEALDRARRTWRRPAATLLHIELLAAAWSSLLWALAALTRAISGTAMEALFIAAVMVIAVWLGPVLFAHSEIACKLSVVVAAAEEEREGAAALQRAEELVRGRRLQGFLLTAVLAQLDKSTAEAAAAGSFTAAGFHIAAKFLSCVAYTKFYQECKKRHQGGKSSSNR